MKARKGDARVVRAPRQPGTQGRLRIGIAGLGIAARQVLPSFEQVPQIQLTAVADVREDELARFRARSGVQTFASVAEMCRSDVVDAVWVATPNACHRGHVVAAAENGKHVICEKPMALSLEECDAMIAAVERNGVKYVQGHSKIYEAPIRKMREIIASGTRGRVIQINTWNYNDWLLRPRLASEVETSQGGGVLYRQGPHQVDIVRFLGGGLVRSVRGVVGRWDPHFDREGNFSALLEFVDGTAATLSFNGYGYFNAAELSWGITEGGRIIPEDTLAARRTRRNGPVAAEQKYGMPEYREPALAQPSQEPSSTPPFFGVTVVACERGHIRQSPRGLYVYTDAGRAEVPLTGCPRRAELAELHDAVTKKRPSFPDARWGKATLEVCLAIRRSSEEQRNIVLEHQVPVPDWVATGSW